MRYELKTLFLSILLSLWCSQGIAQEVISSFEEKNISVLNEELRRLQSKINHVSFTDTTVLEGQYPATDDTVLIGNGATYTGKTIPNCTTGMLRYTQTTNDISCGAISPIDSYTAGTTNVLVTATTTRTEFGNQGNWTLFKKATVPVGAAGGVLTVVFDYTLDDAAGASKVELRVNSTVIVTYTTPMNTGGSCGGAYTTVSNDVTVVPGDVIYVYGQRVNAGSGNPCAGVKNFYVKSAKSDGWTYQD